MNAPGKACVESSTRTRKGIMKRQYDSFIGQIGVSALLLICGASDSGTIACAGESQARGALAGQLEKYYEPPAEFAGKFGSYRSPLKFADGALAKSADDWTLRRKEILAPWQHQIWA